MLRPCAPIAHVLRTSAHSVHEYSVMTTPILSDVLVAGSPTAFARAEKNVPGERVRGRGRMMVGARSADFVAIARGGAYTLEDNSPVVLAAGRSLAAC
jgi:hypothetical protein